MSCNDIDDKKMHSLLDSMFNNIPNIIFLKEAASLKYVKLNKSSESFLGIPNEEVIGKNDFDIFPKKIARYIHKIDRAVLQSKKMLDIPAEEIYSPLLGKRVLRTKKVPILNSQNQPIYLLGISEDITEKLHDENKIRCFNSTLEQTVLKRTSQLAKRNDDLSEEIRKRKETEQKLNDSLMELTLLHEGARIINDMQDYKETLANLIEFICSTIHWPIGHIYVPVENQEALVSSHIWSYKDQDLKNIGAFKQDSEQKQIKKKDSLPGWIWETGKPQWMVQVQTSKRFIRKEAAIEVGIQSATGFPIYSYGKLIAVCEFFSFKKQKKSFSLLTIFELLSIQFSRVFEKTQAKHELDYLAHYDALTDLPNRNYFQTSLEMLVKKHGRKQQEFAMLFLDIDNFKKINDSLGHSIGDKLLQSIVCKIKQQVRNLDFFARIGGDEFIVLIEPLDSLKQIHEIIKRILAVFQQPFQIGNHEISTSVSIGVAVYPYAGSDVSTLMKHADLAMYHAKTNGKNTYKFYSEELFRISQRHMLIEAEARHAIEKEELHLVYQPIFKFGTQTICGIETLLRWDHSSLGAISPEEFIPIIEDNGLIHHIGEWVLDKCCQQMSQWMMDPRVTHKAFWLSVNISVIQLMDNNFGKILSRLMDKYPHMRQHLMLEITESKLMERIDSAQEILVHLNRRNIKFAIDDFGTGYSSLSYLKHLSFAALKIDKSFIHDLTTNANDAAIVKSIIQIGHVLGIDIIAEGIETKEQYDFLNELGCNYAQGFYMSKPLKRKELELMMFEKKS